MNVKRVSLGDDDTVKDPVLLLALYSPIEDTRAGADRSERIAQIVTENGDELLAKPRRFIFQPQHLLGGLFRRHGEILGRQELRLVPASVGRLDQRYADTKGVSVRIAALIGVRDDLQRIGRRREHVERELAGATAICLAASDARRAALRGRPAAIDREIGTGDLRGVVAAQEQRERGDLLGRDELLRGLRCE